MHRSKKESLFDHLVGAGEQGCRYIDAKRLGSSQVDNEIEFRRLLNWKVGRVSAPQYLINILGCAPEQVWDICSIENQTTCFHTLSETGHRRQPLHLTPLMLVVRSQRGPPPRSRKA
jgi:hypothetical protein